MTQMRFVLAFLLITLLFFSFSSLPSAAAAQDDHETALTTTTPFRRGSLRSHINPLKENMKLRVYMKKKASSGGVVNRPRGKSAAAHDHQISSLHHVASVLVSSVLLAGFFKL